MSKHEVFLKEINYIKNNEYKNNVKILLDLLPDYFYEIAASSTGKYHPSYTLGNGGLVRHTKTVVRIAYELLKNQTIGYKFTDREKNLIIMALLLHDGLKHGEKESKYTVYDHPVLMANFIRNNKEKTTLNNEDIEFMASTIETHMGEWNTDYNGNVVTPLPKNRYQRFAHMCDFLASRKFVNVEFDGDDMID